MSPQVLVYSDEGVGTHAFRQLCLSLEAELTPSFYSVKAVNHRTLLDQQWESKTALLVFPGGRDVLYHARLQGEGNRRIAAFVANGGSYMGLCAGGYYGSAYVEFEKGGELEVCQSRELAFFPGRAVGPAYGLRLFSYEAESGARSALLRWNGGRSRVYFNGGCYFENPESYPTVEVLARYHDLPESPAAVIKCSVGKGRALLCGTHPEYQQEPSLEPERRALWRHILDQVLI